MDKGYLSNIFVKDIYQKQGVGSLLLKSVISDKKGNEEITLDTYPNAIEFYKKNDFVILEEDDQVVRMKR